jgi:hypothetical protein
MPLIDDAEEFPTFEPASVSPTSADSAPSSADPEQSEDESTTGTGVDDSGATGEELPEFDERSREDFIGLLFLGALTKEFTFAGHKFVIRTLTTDEILAVGQVVKDYEGNLSQMKAYATAVVAASVASVDGQSLPTPFRDEPGAVALRARFTQVGKWFPYVIDVIYSEFLTLEDRVNSIFQEMGKASG